MKAEFRKTYQVNIDWDIDDTELRSKFLDNLLKLNIYPLRGGSIGPKWYIFDIYEEDFEKLKTLFKEYDVDFDIITKAKDYEGENE